MENELTHHGIKGMRWGIRRTPEQLGHRPSSAIKKLAGKVTRREAGSAIKRKASAVVEKAKSSVKKTEEEKTPEERKQEILKSRSAKAIYDNADLFSDDELRSAYNRLQLERNIASLAPKEVSKGQEYADKFVKIGKTFNEVASTGINVYNNVAKIRNAFSPEGKKNPWPSIKNDDKSKDDKSDDKSSDSKPTGKSNNDSINDATSKVKDWFANQQNKRAEKKAEKENQDDKSDTSTSSKKTEDKVYEGTVEDAPKSKSTSSNSQKKSDPDIIDMEWNESTGSYQAAGKSHSTSLAKQSVTDLATTNTVSTGQNYVAGLLEDSKK